MKFIPAELQDNKSCSVPWVASGSMVLLNLFNPGSDAVGNDSREQSLVSALPSSGAPTVLDSQDV